MERKYQVIGCIVIIILAISGAKLLAIGLGYNDFDWGTAEIAVPIKNEVEQVLPVENPDAVVENEFVYIKGVGFGGAGAGGLAETPMTFKSYNSSDGFVNFVSPYFIPSYDKEKRLLVSTLEYGKTRSGYEDRRVLEKTYWAFIGDPIPLMVYKDVYTHSSDKYGNLDNIERFNETEVVFSYDYGCRYWLLQGICFIFGLILLIFALVGIIDIIDQHYNPPKSEEEEEEVW